MASHRRTSHRTGRVVLLTSAAVVATTATTVAAPAAPGGPRDTADGVASRLDRLYQQAEKATEQHNAAKERADRLQGDLDELRDESARGQQSVNRMRDGLAAVAGAQYRAGGVDPALALMLSSDPDDYLAKASTLERISSRQSDRLDELREAQRELGQKRHEAERKMAELERTRAELAARKASVQRKLATARRLVESMPERQRERIASRLDERASRAGRVLGIGPGPGPGPGPDPEPGLDEPGAPAVSRRAATAVTAARAAVGRPYAWGSAGPGAFDCSGLMVWAYRHAGVALPRTSQAQAYAGQRIPLSQARPGDLVIYRGDASHVGMYVGDGQVVHAPYPGALVRYDPIGMLPVSAVTRPA